MANFLMDDCEKDFKKINENIFKNIYVIIIITICNSFVHFF
jgi:hypothetical protein